MNVEPGNLIYLQGINLVAVVREVLSKDDIALCELFGGPRDGTSLTLTISAIYPTKNENDQ